MRLLAFLAVLSSIHTTLDAQKQIVDERIPGEYFEYFLDPTSEHTIETLSEVEWRPCKSNMLNLGMKSGSVWISAHIPESWEGSFIEFPNREIDFVQAFFLQKGEILVEMAKGPTIAEGLETELLIAFKVPEYQHVDRAIFRIQSPKPLVIPIDRKSPSAHLDAGNHTFLLLGLYIGMMLFLLLYNTFIYHTIRDKSYLWYIIFVGCVTLTQISFKGISELFLWSDNIWMARNATMILTIITAICAGEFIQRFLNVGESIPELPKKIRIYYLVFISVLFWYLRTHSIPAYIGIQLSASIFATFLLWLGITMAKNGKREARFFLSAWSVFLFGVLFFVLKDIGILPYNQFTENTMIVGSALEGLLLSFGLADRIKTLRKEKAQSQRKALLAAQENERLITQQNVILERKVLERTAELEQSNESLKATQSQLVEAEKMASLGQLTAGIAHEINNPINFISASIPPLKRDLEDIVELLNLQSEFVHASDEQRAKELLNFAQDLDITITLEEVGTIVKSIEEGANRTTEIVKGLRNFSRHDEDGMKSASIQEGLRSTVALLDPELKRNIEIQLDLEQFDEIVCLPGKLNQVFLNLMSNGLQAIEERYGSNSGGILTVRTFSRKGTYVIEIGDNGCGMTEDVKNRIFEPFFTTKAVGQGTGLGLSIVHGIIESHSGSIEVDSAQEVGTTIRITLPDNAEEYKNRA